ncbi:MAG: arginase family protein [Streptosporangiales bacterium]|nr:arginase family protein [Streptosporangiales bacterium]
MTHILVPYHLDEYVPDLEVPIAPDTAVTVELPDGDPWYRMAHLYDSVAGAVADAVQRGARPAVSSGDCTTSLGAMTGLQRAGLDPAIVWFDGHGDVQTLETTTSGYLGGMPLRILVGYRPELIADPLGLRAVAEERVTLVDARDLDPPETEYLARAAIRRRVVDDLSTDSLPDGPLYLHLDFDVVDSEELPGLVFPVSGGPGLTAVTEAVRRVIATGRVVAFGMGCTWHPGHGAAGRVRPLVEAALAAWR